jgi:hypothetical protein
MLVGYVLFELYDDAERAFRECGIVNRFLYAPLDPALIIDGFSDNLRSRCVAVSGINPLQKDEDISKMFRAIAPIDGIVVVREANAKVALVHFVNREGVAAAFQSIGKPFTRELLNAHIMIRAGELVKAHPCLVVAMGIGAAVNNAKLRAIFERTGKVQSAMVVYNADNGTPGDRGLVLFENEQDAQYACANPPSDIAFRMPVTVSPYRNKADAKREPRAPPAQLPPQLPAASFAVPPHRPREVLRDYARTKVDGQAFQQVSARIDNLSLDDVYELVMDKAKFDGWLAV